MGRKAIAVDVGGTSIKLGLIDDTGTILQRLELPTSVEKEDAILVQIAAGIEILLQEQRLIRNDLLGVGLGVPGYLDKGTEIVTLAPNIKWKNYPAKSKLEGMINLPVKIDNDANCAAVGERWLGAGKMVDNMIMVTIGTGVGGGIIINGEVVRGAQGIGGEIGHIVVEPDGRQCGCGKIGCLETVASATAIRRKVIESLEQGELSQLGSIWEQHQELTARQVVEAAHTGDTLANAIFDQVAYTLALVLSGLTHALNPDKILIGGGISYAGDSLFEPLRNYFSRFTLDEANSNELITQAMLGNDAGIIGAAYHVFKNCKIDTNSDTI